MKVGLVEFGNGIIMPDGVTVSPAMNVHTISSDLASVKTALDGMQQKTSEWVEDKLTRVGNLRVEISTMKEDLDDTVKAMLEDKKFLAELEKAVPPSRESGMSVARPALRSCSHLQTPSRCSMMMMHLSCSRRLLLVPLPSCRSRSPPRRSAPTHCQL